MNLFLCHVIFSPPHEVVLASLVLVPHGDVQLLALIVKQVQVELLAPLGVQRLVDRLGLVAVVAESGTNMLLRHLIFAVILRGTKNFVDGNLKL